jgi:hypothetical protein
MENSTFTLLSTLQNTLTYKNVKALKKSFIREKFHKHEAPMDLNEEFGILEYYDNFEDKFITLKFENYLKEILWNETQACKEAIDSSLILLDSIKRRKFIEYIKTTIKYIENREIQLFLKFPVCKKPSEEITFYLVNKYNIDIVNNITSLNNESLFKVKSGISGKKFNKLYDITINHNIIDNEFISEETFVSVLLDKDTDEKIIFNCKNGLTMMYLKTISVLFDNMKGKSIENSGRFRTKTGSLISETNFNKAKTSISDDDSETLSNFIKDFDLLLV